MIEKQLLFVCLGNICRSPAAEAVMTDKIKTSGLDHLISCDSAGIIGFHSGAPADARMQMHAIRRGYKLPSISRQVKPKIDFNRFDMVIGMDDQNIKDLKALSRSEKDKKKIFLMTDFCLKMTFNHVPDPYYGDNEDFELVLDILQDACDGLLEYLKTQNRLGKK